MNIGIFTDTYNPIINGVSTSTFMLKEELVKRGHNVYVFTNTNPEDKKNEQNIIRLPSMPFYFLKSQRVTLVYPPQLLFNMKKYNLDIIHTQTEFPLGIFGKIVSQFYKVPLIHTYHTMYVDYVHYIANGHLVTPSMAQGFSKLFCNRTRAIIAPVEKTKESLIDYGVTKPIHVIPTGIDFKPFSDEKYPKEVIAALKEELNINPDHPILISIGRIGKEKSLDVVVRQMPSILRKVPDLKLVIVGDGPFLETLFQLSIDYKVTESIIFAGSKPWSEIGKYYKLGDMFISASTSETQGLTYIESIAAGVPVIAKNDRSVEGVIYNGETGYIFDDETELPNIIAETITNKTLLATIKKNAFENIAHLSSDKFAESVEQLYLQVIDKYGVKTNEKKSISKSIKNLTAKLLKPGKTK